MRDMGGTPAAPWWSPSERAAIGLTLLWGMAATAARAIRAPNDFATAHWLIDYRFGLIRRGLVGSAFSVLAFLGLVPQSRAAVAGLGVGLFVVLCAALVAVAYATVQRAQWGDASLLAVAVFSTSPFVVMSAHLVGYLDGVVFVLAIAAAALFARGRPWAAGTASALGMLAHESFALLGYPLVALAALASWSRAGGRAERRRIALALSFPLVAFVALWVSEAVFLDRAQVRGQLTEHIRSFHFVHQRHAQLVPKWLFEGMLETLESQAAELPGRLTNADAVMTMLPAGVALIVLAAGQASGAALWRRALLATSVAAAPLMLHAIAWDTSRIWSYVIFPAFGCLWLWSTVAGGRDVSGWGWALALGALGVNFTCHVPLMDGETDRFSGLVRAGLYAPVGGVVLAMGWRAWRRRMASGKALVGNEEP